MLLQEKKIAYLAFKYFDFWFGCTLWRLVQKHIERVH